MVKDAKGVNLMENITPIDVNGNHLAFFIVQNDMEVCHVIIKDNTLTL